MKKRTRAALGIFLLAVACLALGAGLALLWRSGTAALPEAPQLSASPPGVSAFAPGPSATPTLTPTPMPSPSVTPTPEPLDNPAMIDNGLPKDKLYVTATRKTYTDGALHLIIPKLGVEVPILNGVDAATLLRGVGLYDYAQLPAEGGANVSIAGHRNGLRGGKITDDMPFYYVNTLTEGDYLYLVDRENIYQYLWECTEVIEPSNWGPIYNQGYGCVTLTTCTPIGVADHRLVVRGALVNTLPLDESYAFPSNATEETD